MSAPRPPDAAPTPAGQAPSPLPPDDGPQPDGSPETQVPPPAATSTQPSVATTETATALPTPDEPAPPDDSAPEFTDAELAGFQTKDIIAAVAQHALFWTGWGLLLALGINQLAGSTALYEIYDRYNLFLPAARDIFANKWYFTYPALGAWAGAFYLRLARMVEWRYFDRRPKPGRWMKAYLAAAMLAIVVPGLIVTAEQLLLKNPHWLGAARNRLPAGGAYLFHDLSGPEHALYDYSIPFIASRYRPGLDHYLVTRGDCIDHKGVAGHLAGKIPFRRYRLTADENGFPGFLDRPAPRADILCVGDSFTHDGVPPRKTWVRLLDDATGKRCYNMGVGGTGPEQQVRFVEHFGDKLAPRTVVWMFFEGNDIGDSLSFEDFRPHGERGVSFNEYRARPSEEFARRYKCLALRAFVRWMLDGRPGGWPDASTTGQPEGYTPPADVDDHSWLDDPWDDHPSLSYLPPGYLMNPPPAYSEAMMLPNKRWEEIPPVGRTDENVLNPLVFPVAGRTMEMSFYYFVNHETAAEVTRQKAWRAAEAAIRRMGKHCRAKGWRLLLVYAPCKLRVYWPWLREAVAPHLWRQITHGRDRSAVETNIDVLSGLVGGVAKEEGVEMLDLTTALRAEAAKGRYVYLHHDTHLSPTGHEIAATAIAERLGLQAKSPK